MRFIIILFLLELILRAAAQDVILESEEGHQNNADNGVTDSETTNEVTKVPNFILLCALIPQIPGCPCDPLLETRPTFYDFLPSDCSCYDSQQSGFSSSPCFCSKPDSDECKCLSGLSSLDEEHDRMCIVSPLTYVTPYANCTSFLNPLGERGLCSGDSEISEHCVTLKSCRRLTPISIEESSVQDKCVTDPESEGCPCSEEQQITDEDALICSCYRNSKNPGCPCDVQPDSPICEKFTELLKRPTSTTTAATSESTVTKSSKDAETTQGASEDEQADRPEDEANTEVDDIVPHNKTIMKDAGATSENGGTSPAFEPQTNLYLSAILVLLSVFILQAQ
ncbi:putative signal peptide-containing secreted protein [Cryptosporidium canis]|uniref:Signal peptide-containing secreted protein n=1 Tax=Cryptosporidium canis TaxID=195482 RepID=A0A9D5HYB1_9CRYT|nr:putative signal peptide-containing secreted protein [Cryptosporidium canis]